MSYIRNATVSSAAFGAVLLGGCADNSRPLLSVTAASEAGSVPNPINPNISALEARFVTAQDLLCGVDRDKGVEFSPPNLMTKYTRLENGNYTFQTGDGSTNSLRMVIVKDRVVTIDANANQKELGDDAEKQIVILFNNEREQCKSLVDGTLNPNLQPGKYTNPDLHPNPNTKPNPKGDKIWQLVVFGVPKQPEHPPAAKETPVSWNFRNRWTASANLG